MSIFKLLNPKTAISNFNGLLRDASNLIFYRRQISSMKDQGLLKLYNLRVDAIKRIYYIVNIEPETLLAVDAPDLEKSRVFESVSKIQSLFVDKNLLEIINVTSTRIKTDDVYAYLVMIKFKPISNVWKSIFQLGGFIAVWSISINYLIRAILNYHSEITYISKLFSK